MPLFSECDSFRLAEHLSRLRQQPLLAWHCLSRLRRRYIGSLGHRDLCAWADPLHLLLSRRRDCLVSPRWTRCLSCYLVRRHSLVGIHACSPGGWREARCSSGVWSSFASALAVVAALNWALDRFLIEVDQRRIGNLAQARLAAIVES